MAVRAPARAPAAAGPDGPRPRRILRVNENDQGRVNIAKNTIHAANNDIFDIDRMYHYINKEFDTSVANYDQREINKVIGIDTLNEGFQAPEDESNIDNINMRLQNCQTLELLYLKKHLELMNTFKFTVNLFDKYKYAIRMLLYILQTLEEAPEGAEAGEGAAAAAPAGIRLPRAIITNMKKLLQDQEAVQRIINDMNNATQNDNIKEKYNEIFPPQGESTNNEY